jgi:hypothetical protein
MTDCCLGGGQSSSNSNAQHNVFWRQRKSLALTAPKHSPRQSFRSTLIHNLPSPKHPPPSTSSQVLASLTTKHFISQHTSELTVLEPPNQGTPSLTALQDQTRTKNKMPLTQATQIDQMQGRRGKKRASADCTDSNGNNENSSSTANVFVDTNTGTYQLVEVEPEPLDKEEQDISPRTRRRLATHGSNGEANSKQRRQHPLQDLIVPALELILQYLSASDGLMFCTRVSRTLSHRTTRSLGEPAFLVMKTGTVRNSNNNINPLTNKRTFEFHVTTHPSHHIGFDVVELPVTTLIDRVAAHGLFHAFFSDPPCDYITEGPGQDLTQAYPFMLSQPITEDWTPKNLGPEQRIHQILRASQRLMLALYDPPPEAASNAPTIRSILLEVLADEVSKLMAFCRASSCGF